MEFPWLVVFDLDGTLIDSSLDLCLSVNAALKHVNLPELSQDAITSLIGDGASLLIHRALQQAGLASASNHEGVPSELFELAFPFFLDFYREHKLDNTRTYDGVVPALRRLRTARPQLPLAVLTNKPVRPSQEICQALGLSSFLFATYGGNSFPTKKPDSLGIRTLMAEATLLWQTLGADPKGFEPRGVTMVGDSPVDVQTARSVGARSVGCLYGLAPEALIASQPTILCESPEQWPELLLTR